MWRDLKTICAAVPILVAALGNSPNLMAVDFAAAKSYAVGTSPAAIAVGDFNGDGKVDIAVANTGSSDVSILLGNSDGTFQPAVNFSAGNNPSAIAVGDFNGDGKLDLAVLQPGANGVAGSVGILLGNGDGSFQAPKTLSLSVTALFMAVADFNLDKKSDLAVGDSAGLNVFIGNGDGTFQPPKQTALFSNGIGIVTTDFNGDAKPDVAVVTNFGIQILLGNGDGTFSSGVLIRVAGVDQFSQVSYESAVASDLNHDGKSDLLVNSSDFRSSGGIFTRDTLTTRISVFLGNGDGSFQQEQVVASTLEGVDGSPVQGDAIDHPFVGDFNGDGKLDLAYRITPRDTGLTPYLVFLLGKGDGSFSFGGLSLPLPAAMNPVSQDLNADKLDDLIFVATSNNIDVQLNTSPTSGADLGVFSLGASPTPAGVGTDLTFTASVLNLGPQAATGVTFTDTLPTGVNFVSATATPGSCVQSNGIVKCSVGALASALNSKVSIVVTPTAVGTITNSMSVTANEPDPVAGNNNATQTVKVVAMLTLTVTKAGNGSGTVTDNGMSGLNCGSTCSANYLQGTSVSLSATPAGDSVFTGWSGACTGSDPNGCSIAMNSNQTVTATFSQPQQGFTLAPASTSLTTQTGKQVTDTLTLTGQNGFSGQVNISCSVTGPAPMATCGVSPSSVMLGSSPSNATLTITAPTSLVAFAASRNGDRVPAYAVVLPIPSLLVGGIGMVFCRSRKRRIGSWLMGGTLIVLLVVLAGCGGGSTSPPPQKTYTVTISATSASGSLQQSTTVTVTVN
jgi:uncharacterized repeat protein (TIGR01451 family)